MKFRFPIVIIDEDFRSENTSGLGIRALADAIEKEGMEVLGVTSYGDLSQFAQQQSRASAFILSIDDEEFTAGSRNRPRGAQPPQVHRGDPLQERRDPDLPVRRDAHVAAHPQRHPARVARLHPHVRGHAGVRRPPHHPGDEGVHGFAVAAVLPRAGRIRAGWVLFVALPGPFRRRRVPEEPGRADVPPVLRREHAARRRLQFRRRARTAPRPLGSGVCGGAQRRTDLQCRPLLLRDQRHVDVEQDGLARDGGAGRHRRRRPQLPRVDPARHHDDRSDSGVPDTDAQPPRHHRSDPARGVRAGEHPEEDRGQPVRAGGEEQAAADPHAHAEHVRRRRLQRRDAEADTERQHRYAAFRRGVAAARRVPRLLQGHARDRQGPPAQQGRADLRDALDAQAARGHLAGLADHRAGIREPEARPAHLQRGVPDAHVDLARSTRSSRLATCRRR